MCVCGGARCCSLLFVGVVNVLVLRVGVLVLRVVVCWCCVCSVGFVVAQRSLELRVDVCV